MYIFCPYHSFDTKRNTKSIFISALNMDTMFGDINVSGLCSIILFYLLILGVGMWAARKKSDVEGTTEEVYDSNLTVDKILFDPNSVMTS